MKRLNGLAVLAGALLASATAATAQTSAGGLVPPRRVTDGRGVDLVSGQLFIPIPLVSFGEHATALSAWLETGPGRVPTQPSAFMNRFGASIGHALRPQAYTAGADGSPDEFGPYENIVFPTGSGFTQQFGQYARLNPDQHTLSFHTNPDGSRYTQSFGTSHFTRFQTTSNPATVHLAAVYDASGTQGIVDPTSAYYNLFQKVVFADGEEWRFYRQYVSVPCTSTCQVSPVQLSRVRSIVSSRGYAIQYLYVSDATPPSKETAGSWYAPRRATAYNKAAVYCDESLLQECTAVSALPSAEISYDSVASTITMREPGATEGYELDMAAGTLRHTGVPNSAISVDAVAVDNAGVGYISRITDPSGQWNYLRYTYVDDSGHIPLMWAMSTNPEGHSVAVSGYGIFGSIQTFTDELGRPYYYSDGFPFRDGGRTEPLGDDTFVGRDDRNNIVFVERWPAGGGTPLRLQTAEYPLHCMNPLTCNRPTWTKDANNNTTDYTYAPEHGGLLTETGPAVNVTNAANVTSSVHPQTRHEYAQRRAWVQNGSGGYAPVPTSIWLRTATSTCRTSAATGIPASPCAGGAADEIRTEFDYGPDSGPNNLLLRGQVVTSTDNGVSTSLRTCYGYDTLGRRISETQPNANLGSCP